ncbi:MAG TPA: hypothetical protein DCZ92_08945 [Elusimicrobia bacterium]|nr:MAG: hypothetical protein A2016_09400 [Elusimicrobia bacterium GWF2_62_30]HBA60932.1 hypothetical protein [Elusimicrobiota bacterium]
MEPKDFPPALAAITLLPLKPPDAAPIAPELRASKHTAFQELTAMKQGVHDEFLQGKLKLGEIQGRIKEDIAALTGESPEHFTFPTPRDTQPGPQPRTAPLPAAAIPGPVHPAAGPAPAGAVKQGTWRRTAIISTLVFCAVLFVSLKFFARNRAASHFQLPPTRAAGLCLAPDGGRVFFSDPQRQLLFEISASDGQVISAESFPASGMTGLAFDGSLFWSSDGAAIYGHKANGGYAVDEVHKASGAALLCWDGGYLWSAAPGGILRRYSIGKPLAENEAYPMPPGRTVGISVAGGTLWLFDPGSGTLSGYKLSARPEPTQTADLKAWLPRKGNVSGFTLRGNYVWLVTENPAELLRIALTHVKFSAAE